MSAIIISCLIVFAMSSIGLIHSVRRHQTKASVPNVVTTYSPPYFDGGGLDDPPLSANAQTIRNNELTKHACDVYEQDALKVSDFSRAAFFRAAKTRIKG